MSNHAPASTLLDQFKTIFGSEGKIHTIRAPGRVNLIGEHTDYNDGFVFPMAIAPEVTVVCRARSDGKVRVASTVFPGQIAEFSINGKIDLGEPKWSNYVRGVAAELIDAGVPLVGMDALMTNTLPVGGGLSSSAAVLVANGLALLTLAGTTMDPSRLALIAQRAEHEFAKVPSGIMDQTIVASGKAGHAMLLDCRDLSKTFIPLDKKEIHVAVVNSMVKHELSGGEYAQRRLECETGVKHFQKQNPSVRALRDVTLQQLESARGDLSDVVYRRCRHVIGENTRTTEAAADLAKRHYEEVGEKMVASHNSLRDDYEVSCEELDFLVTEAMRIKGVYGARMTGGGFGGCIVALVQPRSVETFTNTINSSYEKKFNRKPGLFVTDATAGASVIS
ncbi:MAG: galactokinase [Phycisphaerae bacterium]|nr:galactokinase [Phycisphaerae bacterium]